MIGLRHYIKPPATLHCQFKRCCHFPHNYYTGKILKQMDKSGQDGSYNFISPRACAHNRLDNDFDLDLHAIWRESSCIPAPPPCLCADHEDIGLDFPNGLKSVAHEGQGSPLVECFFHPNNDNQSGFKWTGPDPLSFATQADDLFLYMSAFFLFEEVYWVELRLARFHQLTGETVGEHLFFLPRVETAMGNLSSGTWADPGHHITSHCGNDAPILPAIVVAAHRASTVFWSLYLVPASDTTHDAIPGSVVLCT